MSADFSCLGAEVEAVLDAGPDTVYFNVMDNYHLPNPTIGLMVGKALRDYGIRAPIDVRLMVRPVNLLIGQFADAGATYITCHSDASTHVDRSAARA